MDSDINEQELLDLESKYCSYGDTVHYIEPSKIFESCNGSWLYDLDGHPYLDMQMWYSAVNFGYRNKEIEAMYNEQFNRLPQLACQYLHKEKILLAMEIARETEKRFGIRGRVHFNVGGAQAIEDSIKLIRNYRGGKSLMFAFMGGYHGRTLGCSEITSSYRYRRRYGHFGNRAIFIPYPYCYRCFYGLKRETCNYECIKQFEKLFETEYYGIFDPKAGEAEFSAFYVEPLQATGGYIVPPSEYFAKLDKILKKYNILLVDDEIQMGFYRTGKLWALEHYGIKPDIVTFAKSLTNGLNPLSGLWAKEEMINPEVFPPGSTHSTFSSNPLGTAAGLATMQYMKQHDLEGSVKEKGRYLIGRLKVLQKRYNVIGDVDGLGLALRIEMTRSDGFTPDKALADKIVEEAIKGNIEICGKKYGLVLDIGGYYKNTFTLAPALTISYEEIDIFIELFEAVLKRCGV
ncbi:aspartate aminotransferase family protein [Sporomusa sp.]|uniref:aspartate aminotransferase family protein n=1 Tax=Sporomusa sp. TaxID=2078658 RepID=UPI002C9FE8D3|nr:aminotransferase class III-fold pyridoxal phosphate-dependent enzyme [Sporomusa sp.]HWR05685.1 aminotransferase class III-fold pyridoxal phosphate-dependent enzyme [Sporomusa sp.]